MREIWRWVRHVIPPLFYMSHVWLPFLMSSYLLTLKIGTLSAWTSHRKLTHCFPVTYWKIGTLSAWTSHRKLTHCFPVTYWKIGTLSAWTSHRKLTHCFPGTYLSMFLWGLKYFPVKQKYYMDELRILTEWTFHCERIKIIQMLMITSRLFNFPF